MSVFAVYKSRHLVKIQVPRTMDRDLMTSARLERIDCVVVKPLGILKSSRATMACGAPSRSSDLNGQGRPPLQGGEGLNVV